MIISVDVWVQILRFCVFFFFGKRMTLLHHVPLIVLEKQNCLGGFYNVLKLKKLSIHDLRVVLMIES